MKWWDQSWKLVEGCTPVSAGCANCWAAREAAVHSKHPFSGIRKRYYGVLDEAGRWTGRINLVEKNLLLPLLNKKPMRFVVWNDLFHPGVDEEFLKRVFEIMAQTPQHVFFVLTKRIERAEKYLSTNWPPPNVWMGTSVENFETLRRIPVLLRIPAAHHLVSFEPLIGDPAVDRTVAAAREWFAPFHDRDAMLSPTPRIDWAIVGGESGPRARPCHPDWVRQIQSLCRLALTPFFFKQWGEWVPFLETNLPEKTLGLSESVIIQNDCAVYRVGKKRAGRLLDGKEFLETPDFFGSAAVPASSKAGETPALPKGD